MITDKNRLQIDSELIVALAKQALHNLPHYDNYNSIDNFRTEFGIVKIGLPRQSGHTTAALQLVYAYPNSLLFVPNESSRLCTKNLLQQFTDDHQVNNTINAATHVLCSRTILNIKPCHGREFLIFDGVSRMPRADIQRTTEEFNATIILELQ